MERSCDQHVTESDGELGGFWRAASIAFHCGKYYSPTGAKQVLARVTKNVQWILDAFKLCLLKWWRVELSPVALFQSLLGGLEVCCLPLLVFSPPLTDLEFDSVCFSSTDPIALHKTQVIWLTPLHQVCLLADTFWRFKSARGCCFQSQDMAPRC